MRAPGLCTCLLAGLLAPAVVHSQEETAQRFSEKIEVRVVSVDVVVTDRRGNPLRGLQREDFELFEDGKRMEISNFSSITDGKLQIETDEAEPASPAKADPARSPVTWVVFLDQTNIQVARRNRAMRELWSFLERAVDSGDRGMVASVDGLAFRIRQNMTEDRKAFLETVARLERDRVHLGPTSIEAGMLRNPEVVEDIRHHVQSEKLARGEVPRELSPKEMEEIKAFGRAE